MKRIKYTGYFAFFVNGMLAVMTGTIMTYLRQEYHISMQTTGGFVSAQSIGNLLMVLLSGFLIQLIGRKKALLLFPLLFAIGFGGIVCTDNTILLYGLFALTGLGWGLCNNILNIIFMEDETGGGISFLYTSYAAGSFMGPFLVVLVTSLGLSWKIAILFVAVAALLLLIGFFQADGQQAKENSVQREKLHAGDFLFFKNPRYYLCLVLYFGYIGVEVAVNTWIITYLIDEGLLVKKTAQLMFSVFWLIIIFVRIFTGAYLGKIRRESLLLVQWIGFAAAVTALLFVKGSVFTIVVMVAMAICMAAISPVNAENADEFIKGKGISGGIMFAVGCTGSTILPFLVGAVAEQSGIHTGMLIVAGAIYLMVLACIINIKMKKSS